MRDTPEAGTTCAFNLQRAALAGSAIVDDALSAFLAGQKGLMLTQQRQHPRPIRRLARPLLGVEANLPRVEGHRCSSVRTVTARQSPLQTMESIDACIREAR